MIYFLRSTALNLPEIIRLAGILLILAVGLIHLYKAPEHFEAATFLGVAFVINFVGSLVAAVGICFGAKNRGTGVLLRQILELVKPRPEARYLVFHAMDEKPESDPEGSGYFYETIHFELANHPQTILAYEMKDEPLSIPHWAPVRLRVETQLGYRMVKYLCAIEFVKDFKNIGKGREDGATITSTMVRGPGSKGHGEGFMNGHGESRSTLGEDGFLWTGICCDPGVARPCYEWAPASNLPQYLLGRFGARGDGHEDAIGEPRDLYHPTRVHLCSGRHHARHCHGLGHQPLPRDTGVAVGGQGTSIGEEGGLTWRRQLPVTLAPVYSSERTLF
jgi:DMSO/TMAO reductase YedYZ molybdopterin-dependent catalytic subunit